MQTKIQRAKNLNVSCWWFRNPIPNHLTCMKAVVHNGIELPYQQVNAGFLNHQQYVLMLYPHLPGCQCPLRIMTCNNRGSLWMNPSEFTGGYSMEEKSMYSWLAYWPLFSGNCKPQMAPSPKTSNSNHINHVEMCNELSTIICNESSNKCIYRIQTTKKLETSYRLRSLITVHILLIVILSWRWWRCWMIQQMMRWFNDGTCEMLLFKMAESIQAGLNKTDGKWQNEDEVDTACRLRNPYVLTAFAPGLQKLVATSPKQTKKTKLRQFPRNGEQKPSNSQTPSLRRKNNSEGWTWRIQIMKGSICQPRSTPKLGKMGVYLGIAGRSRLQNLDCWQETIQNVMSGPKTHNKNNSFWHPIKKRIATCSMLQFLLSENIWSSLECNHI